ncbi:peptidylprolyl isomerase, partial [bacterium]|nr:peptidylprolyl isomerase [bacterium]
TAPNAAPPAQPQAQTAQKPDAAPAAATQPTATATPNAAPPAQPPAQTVQKPAADKPQALAPPVPKPNPAAGTPYRGMLPFPGITPPALTEFVTAVMSTDAGDITIEIYPQAAPNAAKRFVDLVKSGFYDATPVYRVVRIPKPFIAQFGINWRPEQKIWKDRLFSDDASLFQLLPGTLAFAKAGPNINSTQVFINYADNNFLRSQGFTAFGRIIDGLDIAMRFRPVGNPSMGLSQERLWNDGEAYLNMQPVQPNMIQSIRLAE